MHKGNFSPPRLKIKCEFLALFPLWTLLLKKNFCCTDNLVNIAELTYRRMMKVGNDVLMLVLFIALCVAASVQLFYYLRFYLAIALYKKAGVSRTGMPVSVIICARNEAENLRRFLPSVLEQEYPSYEVIVVNDCSEDSTDDVLGDMLLRYPHLKVSMINKDPKFSHSKKFAQFIGIKAAEHDLLLFTDADCKAESPKWIEMMVSGFSEGTNFVLGYGGYFNEKGILNTYIRYDTLFIGMQYLGMAIRGIPYMGVGRNLAWKKALFFRNKGFGTHSHLASGDDDLFVNSNATASTVSIELRPDSITRSVPASSFAAFAKQKKRHMTTAKYYHLRHRILLLLEPVSRVIFYGLFIYLLSWLYLWPIVLAVFVLRAVIQGITFHLAGKKLKEQGLVFFSFIFDLFSPLINFCLYLSTFRNRSAGKSWK